MAVPLPADAQPREEVSLPADTRTSGGGAKSDESLCQPTSRKRKAANADIMLWRGKGQERRISSPPHCINALGGSDIMLWPYTQREGRAKSTESLHPRRINATEGSDIALWHLHL